MRSRRSHRNLALWIFALTTLLPALAAADPLCIASDTILCVDQLPGDGRYEIKVNWSTSLAGGSSGQAHALPLASVGITRGGLFWFFAADNPEVIVKVIDGCSANNHAWIYFSAGTNAGFTVTVTDKLFPTHVWTRTNPDLQVAASVADIESLTCDGSEPPPPPPEEPWILTTRPGLFFTATDQHPVERIDIPVAANEEFYKIVVEVEVDLDGYFPANPGGKHNLFSIWRGDDDLQGDLFGELGIWGPEVNEIELVSNADLPGSQAEYRSMPHALNPQGVYSFLYVYDLSSNRTKTYVYQGSQVGQNMVYSMLGDSTADDPIRPEGDGFVITFGSDEGGGIDGNQVPTYGWEYSNLKVYLERPLD